MEQAKRVKRVNMHEAKSRLSELVGAIEAGLETEITIARNGRPAARLVPIEAKPAVRLGLARGRFKVPSLEELDRDNALIERLFNGEEA